VHIEHLEQRQMLAVFASQLSDVFPGATGSAISNLVEVNGSVFFSAASSGTDVELWKSDGTSAGTQLLADVRPGAAGSYPQELINVNGTLFFTALSATGDRELWKSDGTSNGTVLVRDINPLGSSGPSLLANINGLLFFRADDGANGSELWRSDGTSAGTVLVRDINTTGSAAPSSFAEANGRLFFTATAATLGTELWASDGTSTGTMLVRDILAGSGGSNPQYLTNVNGVVFFQAANGSATNVELWKSNGTSVGTVLVKDIHTTASVGSYPRNLFNLNGTLFFSAADSGNGEELWKSDGSSAGTILVRNIQAGVGSSAPSNLQNLGGILYFQANDGVTGAELWRSNGTSVGTVLVADIEPGVADSLPRQLTTWLDQLYFVASTTAAGSEVWTSDGTSSGTVLVANINAGGDASPSNFLPVGPRLFFVASDSGSNFEPYTLQLQGPVVDLSIVNGPLAENGGTATVVSTLSETASASVTVNLSFSGSATLASDYTRSSLQIVIPMGQTSGSLTITGLDDLLDESDETIAVAITSVTGATENGAQSVSTSIIDDDAAPQVTLSLVGMPVTESGSATVRAALSAVSGQAVTIDLAFTGDALFGVDYTASTTQIVIPAGQTSGAITVTIVNDNIDEPAESIVVDIANVTNGVESGTQQVSLTITDNDPLPAATLSAVATSSTESGGFLILRGVLTNPSSVPVTLDLAFSGSAIDGVDYSHGTSQIVIPAGQVSASIGITSLNDAIDEPNELIVVEIVGVTNGTESGTQQVTLTIIDDDPPPSVSLALAGSPFVETGGSATVSAQLSTVSAFPVTVNFSFTGSATLNTDYAASTSSIIILPGQTSGSITLTALSDIGDEPDETVIVDISSVNNGTENGTQRVTATITDDDPTPLVSISLLGTSLAENAGSGTVQAFLTSLSGQTVTINFGFSGTANSSSDYTRTSASIIILAGQTSGSLVLTATNDTIDENDELIVIDVIGVSNGTENGTQQVIATIIDDDAPPLVMLAIAGTSLPENGGVSSVRAMLSNPSAFDVTVDLAFTGSATANVDYSRSELQIVVPAGQTSASMLLIGLNDLIDETGETIVVDIVGVTNGTESGTQQATATIADDDPPPSVSLALVGSPLSENGGVAMVAAVLSTVSALPVTVNLSFGGTAGNNLDYSRSGGQIVINPGEISAAISLIGLNDPLDENTETVTVDIASVTNGNESGVQQVTAMVADDDPTPLVDLQVLNSPLLETGGIATVRATLSSLSSFTVTIDLAYSGSATFGGDYLALTQLVIPAGQSSAMTTITALQDQTDESNESVVVDIINVTNALENGTQQVTASITDDDPPPAVTLLLTSPTIAENGGVTAVIAQLSNPSIADVIVEISFSSVVIDGVPDYSHGPTQILVPAGQLSASSSITALDDMLDEDNETVQVQIVSVLNGTESGTQAVNVTITDDDPTPTVTLSVGGTPLNEAGGTATVTAALSAVSGRNVTINLSFSGTATSGADYSRSGTQISIPAGSLTGSISLLGIDDPISDSNETIIVDMATVTNGTESGIQQVTATLLDVTPDPFIINGTTLTIAGTPGNDLLTVQFVAHPNYSVNINGRVAIFNVSTINSISFDAQGGNDTLVLTTSPTSNVATLSTTGINVSSANYTFSASNLETKYIFGDANDSATISDSAGNDQLYQLPAYSLMFDDAVSYYNQLIGFGSVTANATTGTDILLVYGSAGNDTYTASATQSAMSGSGVSLVGNGFDQVFAYGAGGADTASFTGGVGNEAYYGLGGYGYSVVTSGALLQYLIGFAQTAVSGGDGFDSAILFDSPGNDTFNGAPTTSTLIGASHSDTAVGFEQVFAFASGGGVDTANLGGSNLNDIFSGNAFDAALFRLNSYLLQVYGFEQVNALLTSAGTDIAELIDGAGDDLLTASGGTAEITYASGNKIKVSAFDIVFAKSQNGGTNSKQVTDPLFYQLVLDGTWV